MEDPADHFGSSQGCYANAVFKGGLGQLIRDIESSIIGFSLPTAQPCGHARIVNGICIDCSEKMGDGYGVSFSYINQGLRLSPNQIARLRSKESNRLFRQKKLHLVLDIDQTLVDAFLFPESLTQKFHRFEGLPDDEIVLPGLLVKLRPFVRTFMKSASQMFEMYLYTMGSRSYAKTIAEILDPDGEYFDFRVISRDDSPVMKSLDLVFGEESSVLILDDTETVWPKNNRNLILMEPYFYWEQKTRDENKTHGALANILRVLVKIHSLFFNDRFQAKSDRRDVRLLAAALRRRVLRSCTLYFSNVKESRIRLMAKELGASISKELNFSVTHVVAYKMSSKDCNKWNRRDRKWVHPTWISAAYYSWKRHPETNFLIGF